MPHTKKYTDEYVLHHLIKEIRYIYISSEIIVSFGILICILIPYVCTVKDRSQSATHVLALNSKNFSGQQKFEMMAHFKIDEVNYYYNYMHNYNTLIIIVNSTNIFFCPLVQGMMITIPQALMPTSCAYHSGVREGDVVMMYAVADRASIGFRNSTRVPIYSSSSSGEKYVREFNEETDKAAKEQKTLFLVIERK